jgi:hypothetical protein
VLVFCYYSNMLYIELRIQIHVHTCNWNIQLNVQSRWQNTKASDFSKLWHHWFWLVYKCNLFGQYQTADCIYFYSHILAHPSFLDLQLALILQFIEMKDWSDNISPGSTFDKTVTKCHKNISKCLTSSLLDHIKWNMLINAPKLHTLPKWCI